MASWQGISNINHVNMITAARSYAKAGIPVFPVHGIVFNNDSTTCTCGDCECDRPGKHPRVKWTHNATTNIEQIDEWWEQWPDSNIGIPGGEPSGWLAIDMDTPSGDGEIDGHTSFSEWIENHLGIGHDADSVMMSTLAQKTGGGGYQCIFICPPGIKSVTRWLESVDVKANGGYIVVPPSLHKSGWKYEWYVEEKPVDPPDVLASKLRVARADKLSRERVVDESPDGSRGSGGHSLDIEQALRNGAAPGNRDNFFHDLTYSRRMAGADREETRGLLQRIWNATPGGGTPNEDGRSDFSWNVVNEKVDRIWNENQPDPVNEAGMEWVRRSHLSLVPPVDGGSDGGHNRDSGDSAGPDAQSSGGSGGQDTPDGAETGGSGSDEPIRGNRVGNRFDGLTEDATDMGNGARFARIHRDSLRFVPGNGWHIWDGMKWRLDEVQEAEHLAWHVVDDIRGEAERAQNDEQRNAWARWGQDSQGMQRVGAMMRRAESDPRMRVKARDLDSDPWLFTVENGTVDLKTGLIRESSQEDLFTKSANVEFDPAADCPRWKEHIRLVTSHKDGTPDPELEAFLQRWAGYTLTGLVDEQKFAFLYGSGANGKNVVAETLMEIMGSYATVGDAKLLKPDANEHSTIIADLMGSRIVFIDETPKGKIDEARLKQFTGSRSIKARKMRKDNMEFSASFKIWIAGNSKPRLSDTSEGMWRRLDLIPFDVQIPAENRIRGYHRILALEEGSGILNWALAGVQGYLQLGLGEASRVRESGEEYREEEDVIGRFIADNFSSVSGYQKWIPNPIIFEMYSKWCESQGVQFKLDMRQLGRELRSKGFISEKTAGRYHKMADGDKVSKGYWCPELIVSIPSEFTIK